MHKNRNHKHQMEKQKFKLLKIYLVLVKVVKFLNKLNLYKNQLNKIKIKQKLHKRKIYYKIYLDQVQNQLHKLKNNSLLQLKWILKINIIKKQVKLLIKWSINSIKIKHLKNNQQKLYKQEHQWQFKSNLVFLNKMQQFLERVQDGYLSKMQHKIILNSKQKQM